MLSFSRTVLMAIFILFGHSLFAQFSTVNPKKIDQESLDQATQIAVKLLTGMKAGTYFILTESEATGAMVKGLSEETQKAVYKKVKEENGDFVSLEFVEALQPDNDKNLIIYRFRGNFEKHAAGPEIRVVMNNDLKLAGFWILPWKANVAIP